MEGERERERATAGRNESVSCAAHHFIADRLNHRLYGWHAAVLFTSFDEYVFMVLRAADLTSS